LKGNNDGPVRLTLYSVCSAFFFSAGTVFSLTTIQPKQCFQPVSVKILLAEWDLVGTVSGVQTKQDSDIISYYCITVTVEHEEAPI